MCSVCNANKVAQYNSGITSIIQPATTSNCETSLSSLMYLKNLIDLNINNPLISNEDKYHLNIYKGQVLSGISIQNYCYVDYNVVETNVTNVISKYTII